jgi:hypothetical protein
MASGITFTVADVKPGISHHHGATVSEVVNGSLVKRVGGKLIRSTQETQHSVQPSLGNGFVGAALDAYNQHHVLVIRPDDVWVTITTSLANYIDRHAEEMRNLFVSHEGKIQLVAYSGGDIYSCNYNSLISQISDLVDKNTKDDIRDWIECNFSTTTTTTKIVSKVVLMGAMKNYFSYKFCLCCGLPAVKLEGTVDDWKEIRKRVDRLATWKQNELTAWSQVLAHVLDHFVNAFEGKIDKDFWNRIAHQTGGGSGPRYLEGWILSFIPWTDGGSFVLDPLPTILATNKFGRMNTNDVPASAVEVPVTIDDNGKEYKTTLYAGALVSDFDKEKNEMRCSLDWALIDVTNPEVKKNDYF